MPRAGVGVSAARSVNVRRIGWFALRAFVTVAILAALLTWLRPDDLLAAMKRTGLRLWVVTVIAHVALHLCVVAKWRLLLAATGARTPMRDALRAHGAGVFANLYLPSIVGGEVVRVGMVATKGRTLAAVVTAGIADRAMDLFALVVLTAGGLLFVSAARTSVNLQVLVLAGVGLVGSVAAFLLAVRLIHSERMPSAISSGFSGLTRSLETLRQQKGAALLALAASVSIQASFVVQNVWLGRAIGIEVPIAVWFVAWPLAKLASLSPFSLGGLGVREGVLAALLIPFSVPPTLAVAESLVWQSVMYALGLLGGVTSVWLGTLARRPPETLVMTDDVHTV